MRKQENVVKDATFRVCDEFYWQEGMKVVEIYACTLANKEKGKCRLKFCYQYRRWGLDILNERWWNLEKGGSLCPLVIRYKNDNSYEVRKN